MLITNRVSYPFVLSSGTLIGIHNFKGTLFLYAKDIIAVGERKGAYRVLVEDLTEMDHSEGLSIEGRIIIKWILKL